MECEINPAVVAENVNVLQSGMFTLFLRARVRNRPYPYRDLLKNSLQCAYAGLELCMRSNLCLV